MKKLTTKTFIEEGNRIHNNKYDYSLVIFINKKTKVKIICPEHGLFEQSPTHHLDRSQGCRDCGIISRTLIQRKGINNFILEAENIHGNKYDYSLSDYISDKTKLKIICSEHGIFEQTPSNHLKGKGCKYCGGTSKLNIFSFLSKANKLYSERYDYSLTEYVNMKTKIKVICQKHGVFMTTPNNFLMGRNCPRCTKSVFSTESFIMKANIIHNEKYNYSEVDYKKSNEKIKIICSKHGSFYQTPASHLRGRGCPICNFSRGELIIMQILEEANIRYIPQKTFDGCRIKRKLPFDFYLLDYNICIEYDGIQHFESVDAFGGDVQFLRQKNIDTIKNNYCEENNIPLIRIAYNEHIILKLKEELNKLNIFVP